MVELEASVKRASKLVALQWPGVMDTDDIEQSIWLHLVERPGTVESLLGMEDKPAFRSITRIGHRIAAQERMDYDYYNGSYRYSHNEIKSLLEDGIIAFPLASFTAERVDMLDALEEIAEPYKAAILRRYVELDTKTSEDKAFENALKRGLEALVDEMNKCHKRRYSERDDGPGTRAVESSIRTVDRTRREYGGDNFDFEQFAGNQGIGWD